MVITRFRNLLSRSKTRSPKDRSKLQGRWRKSRLNLEPLEDRWMPSNITWNGNAGDGLWNTAGNWIGGVVPGATDNAKIDNTSSTVTITLNSGNVSVHSLSCTKNFVISGGAAFTVAANSSVSGAFTLSPGTSLTDTAGTFTASGSATIDGGNLFAQTGGGISLATATGYNESATGNFPPVETIQASGTGSTIDLHGVTTIANGAFNSAVVNISATAGGHVNLSHVTQITDPSSGDTRQRAVNITADGTGSQVDLTALTTFQDVNNDLDSSLTATHSGTILDPALTSLGAVAITVDSTGTLATSQITTYTYGSVSVTGATQNFTNLTDADGTSFFTLNAGSVGGIINLPALVSYNQGATTNFSAPVTIQANGTNSQVNFGALTTITNGAFNSAIITINALAGGHVGLSHVTQIVDPASGDTRQRATAITANGTGSQVDLSAMTKFIDVNNDVQSSLSVASGGTILDGALTTLDSVALIFTSGAGTLGTSQITTYNYGTVTVVGTTVTFTNLTNADGSNFLATNAGSVGGIINLPALVSYNQGATANFFPAVTFQASGTNSQVNFGALTTITNGAFYSSFININALAGGHIGMSHVTQIVDPASGDTRQRAVTITADAGGSQVDLSALTSFVDVNNDVQSSLNPTNGGTILDPALTTLESVALNFNSTNGALSIGQITSYTFGTTTTTGASVTFTNLTNANGSNFFANSSGGVGGVINLPALVSYNQGATANFFPPVTIQANGINSQVNFGALTTITNGDGYSSFITINALAGGHIGMSHVTQIVDPANGDTRQRSVAVTADGSGSQVDLSALTSFVDQNNDVLSSLTATHSGTILSPALTSLQGVSLTFDNSSGTITTSHIVSDIIGNVTLNGVTHDFSGLTTATGSTFTVTAATLNLTNLANADGASFIADTGGSTGGVINLPALTNFNQGATANFSAPVTFEANGANSQVNFPNLTTITNGAFYAAVISINAKAGGNVNLHKVNQILDPANGDTRQRAVNVLADGSGSQVDLTSLTSLIDQNTDLLSTLTATNSGTILDPVLKTLQAVALTFDSSSGTIATNQIVTFNFGTVTLNGASHSFNGLTTANFSTFTVTAATLNLNNLANADGSDFLANSAGSTGGVINAPAVTSYNQGAIANFYPAVTFQATGANSQVNMVNLTNITNGAFYSSFITIKATAGGTVNMHNVSQIVDPATGDTRQRAVTITADGAGSLVNLSSLAGLFDQNADLLSTISATTGGTVDLSSNRAPLGNVSLTVSAGSTLNGSPDILGNSTLVGAGTIVGNVTNRGAISTGTSTGILTITGNYTQTFGGTLTVQIGGLSAGNQYDQVAVSGSVTLDGTLAVNLINGFTPVNGNNFRVLTFTSRVGDFAFETGLNLGGNKILYPNYDGTGLNLTTFVTTNKYPVISNIPNQMVAEGGTVNLTVSATDPDGDNLTYSLASTPPPGASINPTTGAFTFTPTDGPLTFVIVVHVTDNGTPNLTSAMAFNIVVTHTNPTATFSGPTDGFQGIRGQVRDFVLGATSPYTDDQSNPFTWVVNWGDGSTNTTVTGFTGTHVTHVYTNTGMFTASAVAMDEDGASSTAINLPLTINVAEVQGGVLMIGGTAADDLFDLTPVTAVTDVAVKVNNVSLGTFHTTAGQVQVFGYGGTNTLSFDDQTQSAAETYKVTTTTVNRTNSVTVTFNQIQSVIVNPGSGTETVDVQGSVAATPVTVNAGLGKETINVGSSGKTLDSIQGAVTITGGSKQNTSINLNDQNASADETYAIAANSITRSGAAPVNFGIVKKVAVNGGGGNNTFTIMAAPVSAVSVAGGVGANSLVGLNQANAWTITGLDAGKVGNVSFKKVGNLVGGTGVDVFEFSDAASLSGTVNGGGGGDWLDYSLYTTAVTVNLSTGAASGVVNGVTNIQNVIGGAGNDTITGNAQGNILVGGGGSNTLIGGSGRSVLIGGLGGSTVTGGSADDIVIGGTTTFDDNTKALASILQEWQRTDKNYTQRIADLKTGGGFNGNNKLIWGTTVLDNNAADTLTGGAGLDWFFANLGPNGVIDTITDLNNGGTEQVN